jgi:hypothetical protein
LEKNILTTKHYHTFSNLRDENGALIDSQMTFIIVELAKFDKQVDDIETDLEKLVYTMKTVHKVTEATQYPRFWNEEWLSKAIEELNTRSMSPEERFHFARITAINAEVVYEEKRKIEEAKQEENLLVKTETVTKALKRGKLSIEEIAEDNDVTLEFVIELQKHIDLNK